MSLVGSSLFWSEIKARRRVCRALLRSRSLDHFWQHWQQCKDAAGIDLMHLGTVILPTFNRILLMQSASIQIWHKPNSCTTSKASRKVLGSSSHRIRRYISHTLDEVNLMPMRGLTVERPSVYKSIKLDVDTSILWLGLLILRLVIN